MKKELAKYLVLLGAILSPMVSFGQFKFANVGVDGLTCSACSRAVEMSIRKLNFVDSVSMNLNNTEGKIYFKRETKVSIEEIAKAVTDAGFSVRYLSAVFNFNNVVVEDNFCWNYENNQYLFVKTGNKNLNGDIILNFIGKKYLAKAEMKKWTAIIKNSKGCDNKKSIYYVTI